MSACLPGARVGAPMQPRRLGPLLAGLDVGSWQGEEARRLCAAEGEGRQEVLLSARRPGLTLEDAYRVQWRGAALRMDHGARVIGHKVGLTSEAMQQQVGIGEPDSGLLLDTMAVANGGRVLARELRAPHVEAEIAFRLGDDLFRPGTSEAEARSAVAGVCVALEVIDSRFELDGITLADSVADNAGCARFALGEVVTLDGLDLRDEEVTLAVAGQAVASGRGGEILGDPIRSLVWLARRLAGFGAGLSAGDIVLAGAVHASIPLPQPGACVSASSAQLGQVVFDVA